MCKYYSLIISIFLSTFLLAQQPKEILTEQTFIQFVKQNHPLAKVALLQVDKAQAELLAAKGGFDPSIAGEADRKTLDGKNYYYHTNPELKIPTPIGVDVKTGIENNGGDYLSSEYTKGSASYAGVEIALAKGLLIDKRRAALQQAKIYINQSEQEKRKLLNDLLYDASVTYWHWAGSYQLYSVYSKFLQFSNDRFRLVKVAYNNGDRSLADTIEAYTQVQNFQLLQAEALLKLNAMQYEMSNFLWLSKDSAVVMPNYYVPDTVAFNINTAPPNLQDIIGTAMSTNPSIRSYDFKINSLKVEQRLKTQSLLPTLNLKANLLSKDYYSFKNFNSVYYENNYKWGIDFKMPLFLREARGDVRKAKLKITETNLELTNKKTELTNKIRNYHNEASIIKNQLSIVQNTYNAYNQLLKAETLKFNNGESSLFLVNSRENKVLEAMQKQIELRVKYFKALYSINWAAGLLN